MGKNVVSVQQSSSLSVVVKEYFVSLKSTRLPIELDIPDCNEISNA
jgi:hypothetical protein